MLKSLKGSLYLCFLATLLFYQSASADLMKSSVGGIGVSGGIGIEDWTDNEDPGCCPIFYPLDGKRNSRNFGLVIDTNLSGDQVFNYRFSMFAETNKPKGGDGLEFTGLSTMHDFGFGVVRTRNIRLWLGPRIQVGLSEDPDQNNAGPDTATEGSLFSLGYGVSVGINFNTIRHMTISVTYAYLRRHFSGEYWTESASSGGLISKRDVDVDSSGSYAEVSFLYRFSNY